MRIQILSNRVRIDNPCMNPELKGFAPTTITHVMGVFFVQDLSGWILFIPSETNERSEFLILDKEVVTLHF